MSDPQYKDAITYQQPLAMEIIDPEVINLFYDDNLMKVLDFLRTENEAMTVKDLEIAFEEFGKEKSTKTIYRYLKKLESANLVVPAGKRVFPLDKKLKTQTLYMRSARIFLPMMDHSEEVCEEDRERKEKMTKAIGLILANQMKMTLKSTKCISDLIIRIKERDLVVSRNVLTETTPEIEELVTGLNWKHIEGMMSTVGLLLLLSEKSDWESEITKCFEDKL